MVGISNSMLVDVMEAVSIVVSMGELGKIWWGKLSKSMKTGPENETGGEMAQK